MSHDSEIKFTLLSISRVSSSHRLYSLAAVETSLLPLPESSCVERATENPEASLSGVEPLMQKIRSEIRHVDAGILAAVCQQSNSGTKPKEDLAAATCAVEVNSLASAVEQLQVMASKQKYTEVAAQLEMLLDTQAIKTVLLDIPSLGRQATSTASYSKFVTREMSKAEALLKGLKKADQQSILDDFNKHGRGIKQPAAIVPLVAPPAAPAISPAMTASSPVGFIVSREYVLTRAHIHIMNVIS
ncbi:hypothetical protein QYF36_018404 [Acer negundo]|nr:hypothetical protein QYF36_018404 [Acer negundo]